MAAPHERHEPLNGGEGGREAARDMEYDVQAACLHTSLVCWADARPMQIAHRGGGMQKVAGPLAPGAWQAAGWRGCSGNLDSQEGAASERLYRMELAVSKCKASSSNTGTATGQWHPWHHLCVAVTLLRQTQLTQHAAGDLPAGLDAFHQLLLGSSKRVGTADSRQDNHNI